MSEKIQKVLSNCVQGLTDAEQLQARTNIGAIGGVKVKQAGGSTEELVPDSDGKVTVDLSDVVQVQSDWTEDNPLDPSYINNKPDLATVATSGDYDDLRNKPTIPQPVQSDWTESDSADPSYIQNKPNLATVATSGSYEDLTDKPDIPGSQVQSDWTETDTASKAYILHKPTIPAAQVQSDWAQSDSSAVDYIKNKPSIAITKELVAGTNMEIAVGATEAVLNSKGTKIETRTAPYSAAVDLTSMSIYDPSESFGSVVKDTGGNTIGFLAPKHLGNLDVGKVLTIVNDNGYKMEWMAPSGGSSALKVLTRVTQPLTSASPVTLTIADGYAYTLEMQASLSSNVTLATNSTDELHSLIYVKNGGGTHCGTVTLVWRDAALEEHTAELDMTEQSSIYCFDVRIRKVHVGSTDYAIAAVHDYPVAYRNALHAFATTNETTQMVGVWL